MLPKSLSTVLGRLFLKRSIRAKDHIDEAEDTRDEFQTLLSHLPLEFESDQLCAEGGEPRLWNEVDPRARYPSNDRPISGAINSDHPVSKQKLYGKHRGHVPFTPYIEKRIWKPHDLADTKLNDYIDLQVIRNWIEICTNQHGVRCDWIDGENHEGAQAMFLIDVENMKLVRSMPGLRYVALSYVWGQRNVDECASITDCMTSRNLSELLMDNSLASSGISVAKVILDAMDLVRNINQKFLWVDKFCIPQDGGLQKQSQLNSMALIYSNAWLTIIAAQNSDASQGLYGYRQVIDRTQGDSTVHSSNPRLQHIDVEELTNQEIMNYHARVLMCSQWFSRGWTFQEHICSRRRLLFHNNLIGWECQESSWHESQDLRNIRQPPERLMSNRPTGLQSIVDSSWPDMYRYARIVTLYNRRALTYPEDVFDGFRGFLSLFSRSCTGANISGLPEMFFNAALLWQPWLPMTRRRAKRGAQKDALLPSWSWIGWWGDVNMESWACAFNYLLPTQGRGINPNKCLGWNVIKTVDWFYSQSLQSQRQKVVDSSLNYRSSGDGRAQADGWTKRNAHGGRAYWQHWSDPAQKFWYPIPINGEPQLNRQEAAVSAQFVHGKTRRALFEVGGRIGNDDGTRSSVCMALKLLSPKNKQLAGFLRVNLFFFDDAPATSEICELVELSAGSFEAGLDGRRLLDEWDMLSQSINKQDYEFYNVMCVKTVKMGNNFVSYRRAVGRVEKSKWNSVAEKVDITLG